MRISREARILLAFVAVAGAAWVWINFFSQPNPGVVTQTPAPGALQNEDAAVNSLDTTEGLTTEDVTDTDLVDADSADADLVDTIDTGTATEPTDELDIAGEVETFDDTEVFDDLETAATDEASVDGDAAAGDDALSDTGPTSNAVGGNVEDGTEATAGVNDAEEDETVSAEDGDAEDGTEVETSDVLPSVATATPNADSIENETAAETASDETVGEAASTETTPSAEDGSGEPDETAQASSDEDLPSVDSSETADETDSVESSPSIATAQPVTAREVEVAELPFLVTEPPAPGEELAQGEEGGLELSRPRSGLRATVNPFSPLVVRAPPAPTLTQAPPLTAATTAPTTTATAPTITEVPIPGRPGAVGPGIAATGATATGATATGATAAGILTPGGTVSASPGAIPDFTAPTPRPLTPGPTQASNLPRPLPGGILSSTPDILRNTRVTPVATPTNALGDTALAEVAALRVPGQSSASVNFNEAPPAALEARAESDAIPLPLGANRPAPAPAEAGTQTGPLVAGTSGLSRYLRDNNYQFTGSVIGPIGVGVFRSNLSPTPITVVLGQPLLDTTIVLTSLQGKQAEFTQNDEKQVLTLDLR